MSRRDYKGFAAGETYHVFNRGNDKMDIFREQADYTLLLFRLKEILAHTQGHLTQGALVQAGKGERHHRKSFARGSFSLIAYCLMPNHFHFAIQQNTDTSISELMLSLVGGYSKYFNKKYERVGSLFQDQFKAVHIKDNTQLLHLSAYIHQNPKTAGLVSDPADYPYSSYREYIDLVQKDEAICDPGLVLGQFAGTASYKAFVDESLHTIRRNKELEGMLFDD
jgi:putative transposase